MLRPGGSVAVELPGFAVRPGTTYGLSVSVSPPPGQVNRTMLSGQLTVDVAPPTPPTTAPSSDDHVVGPHLGGPAGGPRRRTPTGRG